MHILFMGSPDFCTQYLEKIIKSGRDEVIGIFTQPDRPQGRGHRILYSKVKSFAIENNIPLFQPENIKGSDILEEIKDLTPELILVIAYGHILPGELLRIPQKGCVNIHFSLLPKYRGPAPIQWTLINGETRTGVTSILMDEVVDHGKIILQEEIEIRRDDNILSLRQKLVDLGVDVMERTLDMVRSGNPVLREQDEKAITHAPLIKKEEGQLNWEDSAESIFNKVRALNSWPSTFTHLKGKRLKILGVLLVNVTHNLPFQESKPGQIVSIEKDKGFIVKCGEGFLLVTDVQSENKARCKAYDFLQGAHIGIGDRFAYHP